MGKEEVEEMRNRAARQLRQHPELPHPTSFSVTCLNVCKTLSTTRSAAALSIRSLSFLLICARALIPTLVWRRSWRTASISSTLLQRLESSFFVTRVKTRQLSSRVR
uniref:Uncharacterized protein n=1 Tax=Cacopsylla melanoneura TaxID=428564 RepID=A0A8D8WWJ1_9HEMI